MKRLIFSILGVSLLFLGVGAVVENTSARYKSDEKALELVRKARLAIGGDAAIASVQSVVITGRTTQILKIDGVERSETGDTEIALQFPDKVSRITKLGSGDASGKTLTMHDKVVDVVVLGDAKAAGESKMKVRIDAAATAGSPTTNVSKKIIIKSPDGTVRELTGADADAWVAAHPGEGDIRKEIIVRHADGTERRVLGDDSKVLMRKAEGGNATFTSKDGKTFDIVMDRPGHEGGVKSNEMLRLTLGLLLTAPAGIDVAYTLGGTGEVDGRSCNVVVASFAGQSFKLYLDGSSNLPLAIGYKGMPAPHIAMFKHAAPPAPGTEKDVMVFKREGGPIEPADVLVKFSDYRAVNGVQLPFKWTQVGGGDNVFDVTNYDVNPTNIASKFENQKVFVRTKQ
jgi:hypothetical protein